MKNYIAITELSDDGTWWISFPGLPGVTSAADGPEHSAAQAQDALVCAIEDGRIPPYDLGAYQNRLVLLVPYVAPAPVAVA